MKLTRKILNRAISLNFLLLIATAGLSMCNPVERQAMGGYTLLRSHSQFHSLVDENSLEIIPANIEKIGVDRGVIFGYLNPRPYVSFHHEKENVPTKGYFLFDENVTFYGLEEEFWRQELAKRGVYTPLLKDTE